MPVVRKKGALFAVYHDSPPRQSSSGSATLSPSASTTVTATTTTTATAKPHSLHVGKKEIISGRSPTQRHKQKSASASGSGAATGTGNLKPSSHAASVASSALQTHTMAGTGTGRRSLGVLAVKTGNTTVGRGGGRGVREVFGVKSNTGGRDKEKENLRSLGMGSMHGTETGKTTQKLAVFVDPFVAAAGGGGGDVHPHRPITGRRAFREKTATTTAAVATTPTSEATLTRAHPTPRDPTPSLRLRRTPAAAAVTGAGAAQMALMENENENDLTFPCRKEQENIVPAGETPVFMRLGKRSAASASAASSTANNRNGHGGRGRVTLTSAPSSAARLALVGSPRRMSTRSLASARHDSAMEEDGGGGGNWEEGEESPYIFKPRLRKLNQQQEQQRKTGGSSPTETGIALSSLHGHGQAGLISSQTTTVQVVSSQPQPHPQSQPPPPSEWQEQEQETRDDNVVAFSSSPLIERPRTRKHPTTLTSSHPESTTTPPPAPPTKTKLRTAGTVLPDPVLCDVSEAYGADTRFQPVGFQRQFTSTSMSTSGSTSTSVTATTTATTGKSGARRAFGGKERESGGMSRVLRERGSGSGKRSGSPSSSSSSLAPSTYGWTQISLNEYRAPSPPRPSAKRRKGAAAAMC